MFLLFLLVTLVCSNTSPVDSILDAIQSLCPASAVSQRLQGSEIYYGYPTDIYGSSSVTHPGVASTTYKCSSPEDYNLHTMHSCSTESICPVYKQNVQESNFADDSRACLRAADDQVLVVVIGGTVTLGANAGGCCCSEDIDPRCKGTNVNCGAQKNPKMSVGSCSWVGYFERFLSRLGSRYKLINLAIHGSTSTSMASQIRHILSTSGITVTSKDIVLIDYSAEPQTIYSREEVFSSTSGMELLIRNIMQSSARSWPSIVLLQMHALHFSQLYGALCIRYRLSMWSLKNIVKSSFAANYQEPIIPYLNFKNNYNGNGHDKNHPPWHVHMFYADLISNLFYTKFHLNCSIGIPEESPVLLPRPLSRNEHVSCEGSSQVYLIEEFRGSTLNLSLPWLKGNRKHWPHIEDEPGHYGLVSLLEGGEDEVRSLSFDIPKEILALPPDQEILLQYTFQRTNNNAGAVQINICERWFDYADALWANFLTVKISVSITHSLLITVKDIHSYCHGDERPFLIFEHYHHISRSKEESIARTVGQKFRLEFIQMCDPVRINGSSW